MSDQVKPIEISTVGEHISSAGIKVPFSAEDFIASAKAYDPELHEAPIVIGHPKDNAPAYGWIESLTFNKEDQALDGLPKQVEPQFAEMHNSGRFPKRSAAFYHPDSPRNPVPGVYYLRHLGFLGAQPPAIKGLKSYEFSESEDDIVTVEFGEEESWAFSGIARMFRRFREWMIEKHGVEEADKVLAEWSIQNVEEAAKANEAQGQPANFSGLFPKWSG